MYSSDASGLKLSGVSMIHKELKAHYISSSIPKTLHKMSPSETLPLIGSMAPVPSQRSVAPFRWNIRRRRRCLPSVRLGGDQKKRRGGFFLIRVCRRAKLKWLRLKYLSMIKKLKKLYESFVEDLVVARMSTEEYQKRLILECSAVVPIMGL